mmetsp:Transcript_17813/g.30944  ORF Transcript_17813/g.30944 Transcript_17813/m.30944 type:complete len:264 (+) Transcript_17813:135-926(+)
MLRYLPSNRLLVMAFILCAYLAYKRLNQDFEGDEMEPWKHSERRFQRRLLSVHDDDDDLHAEEFSCDTDGSYDARCRTNYDDVDKEDEYMANPMEAWVKDFNRFFTKRYGNRFLNQVKRLTLNMNVLRVAFENANLPCELVQDSRNRQLCLYAKQSGEYFRHSRQWLNDTVVKLGLRKRKNRMINKLRKNGRMVRRRLEKLYRGARPIIVDGLDRIQNSNAYKKVKQEANKAIRKVKGHPKYRQLKRKYRDAQNAWEDYRREF